MNKTTYMKQIFTLTFFVCILSITNAFAQSKSLPYNTGFDNTAEQAGWDEMRLGINHTSQWSVGAGSAVSAPNSVYHDYPVGGTATDTVEDWYISPAINLSGTNNKLEFKTKVYTIFQKMPVDFFAVYFSNGSKDPNDGDYTLIMELTDSASSDFNKWLTISNLNLPSNVSNGFIAFRYIATQNWFTINIDDVKITGNSPTGINDPVNANSLIYPNPLSGNELNFSADYTNARLYDLNGKQLFNVELSDGKLNYDFNSLQEGIYIISFQNRDGIVKREKLFVQ